MFRRFLSTATKAATDLSPLKFEQNLYASVKIHEKSYLITKGDLVHLPFKMHAAHVGDVINFTKIDTIGSRNYTLHADEGVDTSNITIQGVVVEKTKKPMIVKEVTKRRDRHVKHLFSKHDLTVIRISELKIN